MTVKEFNINITKSNSSTSELLLICISLDEFLIDTFSFKKDMLYLTPRQATSNLLGVYHGDFHGYLSIPEIKALYDEHFKKDVDLFSWYQTESYKYYVLTTGYIDMFKYSLSDATMRGLKENYNLFPTGKLAEMAKDLSKDSRKALLWQYANNCVFVPNWNCRENKYYVYFNFNSNEYQYLWSKSTKHQITYFKTSEDAQNYIKFLESEDK